MKKIIITCFTLVMFVLTSIAQTPINHTYPFNDGPDKNPMKGWSSGWWDDFELSSVGFQYIKWKDFEPSDGNFSTAAVEDVINRPGSQGRHLILRLYADWFGNNETSDACPPWLYTDYGVARLQAPNGKYITDYNDPNYITQVTEAIEALAQAYDDDPRVYTIQLGVLGYWGEWHSFTFNDNNFEIEEATKSQILNVIKANFSNTKLMGRQPWDEPLASDGAIGFHNDFFVPNDGHSEEFDDAIAASDKWKEGPIGGENPPIDEGDREQFMTDLYETATGLTMINTGHYSTMKLGNDLRPSCENDPNSSRCQGFMELHRKMGYNFQIESAIFPESVSQSDQLVVELNMQNIGVAPIYYNWDVQFALIDTNNDAVETFEVPFDLTTIPADGSVHAISMSTALNGISADDYELAVRFIQPGADEQKTNPWQLDAENTYIGLSNNLPTIEGTWDNDNALIGGWSVLGPVSIEESSAAVSNILIFHKTNGFRHGSIDDGIALITELGNANGLWTTTETEDSSNFNAATLANYDLVIWCNTSGNGLLTIAEQQAFETWLTVDGGAFMGIHAATDTYRNGSWPFYNELVGAIVQSSPNHTSQNHNDNMDVLESHSSVDHLDAIWNKTEEYYYWELNGGQLSTDNNNVLFVESTGSNSYDAARPMAWYKKSVTVDGVTRPVRAFYTALGHSDSNYSDDDDFIQHIEGAIKWALPAGLTTYAEGAWNNGAPDANMIAVVDANFNTATDGNIQARNLVINSGVTVNVEAGTYLDVREDFTINGSLIVEHEGSVLQTSAVSTLTNNGTINVNLTTPDLDSRDFMILGSPMTGDNVNNVWDDAFLVLEHNTLNFIPNQQVEDEMPGAENFADDNYDNWSGYTGAINPAEGYIVRPQAGFGEPGGIFDYTYREGTLNNGDITFDIIYQDVGTSEENKNHSPNVLANPYASAISADRFIRANEAVEEVFFWEHLTPPNPNIPGAGAMNFSMEDISMYNLTGGTAAANDPGTITEPNGFISTGQGFAIKANSDNDVVFSNSMRRKDNNNTLRNSVNRERIWLSVHNLNYDLQKIALIGFNSETTPQLDSGYDSKRLATVVSIYSHLPDGTEQLGIQSREEFNENIEIPIGFSTQIDDLLNYKIAISDMEGESLSNVEVFLLDTETNDLTNLSQEAYQFTSGKGTFHNRFLLQFREEVLAVDNFDSKEIIISPNPARNYVDILSTTSMLQQIEVFDALGRKVLENDDLNKMETQLDISGLLTGTYIMKIHLVSGSFIKRLIKE